MEKYHLKRDIKVFGKQVKTFPSGIGEAFHDLIKLFPENEKRSYYGICKPEGISILYYASAEECLDGEAEKYGLDTYTIEGGEYVTETVRDWRTKTDTISQVFHQLGQNAGLDGTKPFIEWYKSDDEMLCMIKIKDSQG